MKRFRVLRITILLAAGMLLNFPVAWGLLLWGRWVQPDCKIVNVEPPRWPEWASELPSGMVCSMQRWMETWYTRVDTCWAQIDGLTAESMAAMKDADVAGKPLAVRQGAQGWPFRSVRWRNVDISEAMNRTRRDTEFGVQLSGRRDFNLNVLGLLPVWPGFALNGVLYAAVLGAVMMLPRRMRDWRRSRRGLCLACGYPRGGEVCPECGGKCGV